MYKSYECAYFSVTENAVLTIIETYLKYDSFFFIYNARRYIYHLRTYIY